MKVEDVLKLQGLLDALREHYSREENKRIYEGLLEFRDKYINEEYADSKNTKYREGYVACFSHLLRHYREKLSTNPIAVPPRAANKDRDIG